MFETKSAKETLLELNVDPKESLFSRGGYFITFGYGIVITITTVFAFLMIPVFEHGAKSLNDIAILLSENEQVLLQSQTAAFCVLSLVTERISTILSNTCSLMLLIIMTSVLLYE